LGGRHVKLPVHGGLAAAADLGAGLDDLGRGREEGGGAEEGRRKV